MAVQLFISIHTEAGSVEEAQAIIDGLTGLPEGASVSSQVSQPMTSGTVDNAGTIVEPAPPEGAE